MRVETALIMVTDVENIEDAKESIEEQVDQILQGWTEEGWKGHPDIRLATRSELEELAAAGALLPNPGVIEVKKPKAVRVKPGMKFNNGSTIKVIHTGVDPIRGTGWKKVEDEIVRHRWVHQDDSTQHKPCPKKNEAVYVSPDFYAEGGTPVCPDCEEGLCYDGTEILEE